MAWREGFAPRDVYIGQMGDFVIGEEIGEKNRRVDPSRWSNYVVGGEERWSRGPDEFQRGRTGQCRAEAPGGGCAAGGSVVESIFWRDL